MTSRRYTFTSFEEAEPTFNDVTEKYMIFGAETCPKTQKKHWQGYVEFKNSIRMPQAKKILGEKFHIEVAKGTREQNITYCSKEGNAKTFGQTGTKKIPVADWGKPLHELVKQDPEWMLRNGKKLVELRRMMVTPQSTKPTVIVIWGDPGTGKTRTIYDLYTNVWRSPDNTGKWFDGYDGQEIVLFDDFNGEMPYKYLLQVLDRYPLQVPVKGGYVHWNPKKIYITSNTEPAGWYMTEDYRALRRRIDEVVEKKTTTRGTGVGDPPTAAAAGPSPLAGAQ